MDDLKKIAEASLLEALGVARAAGSSGMRVKLAAFKQPTSSQQLRATASSAWRMGTSPPKPKTIGPNSRLGAPAKTKTPAKPPSKKAFYRDMVLSMDPSYGNRMAVKG